MSRIPARTIRIAALVYVAALTVVSLLPSGRNTLGGWDSQLTPTIQNALHVPAYAGLMVLVYLGFQSPRRTGLARLFLTAAACGVFGAALEIAQWFVPGRTPSAIDVLLNLAGVALGVTIALSRRKAGRTTKASVEGLL